MSGRAAWESEFLDRLLASSSECIKVLDTDGRLLLINPAGCRLLDIDSPERLLNTRWPHYWEGPAREDAEKALAAARAGISPPPFEAGGCTSKGSPRWWEVQITPVRGRSGAVERILVTARDITERRRAESLLLGQNRILELVASGVPLKEVLESLALLIEEQSAGQAVASIFLVDDDGKRLRVAAAPSLPDAYNRAVDGIEIRTGLGTCADAAARGAATITPSIGEASGWVGLAHLPSELGLHSAWSMPIISSNGAVLGTIGTYFRDRREPTERERRVVEGLCRTAALAIERRTAEETTRREKEQMALVVRGAEVGVWYCPLPFDRLVWDAKVKEHFHLAPDDEVTIAIFFDRLHPQDRERTKTAIEQSIARGEPYDIDYRTVSADGARLKWIRAMGRGYYDSMGRPTRFDGITLDVTGQKLAEQALRTNVETLATLNSLGLALATPTDTETIVQAATDAGTTLTKAAFGAFFYNVINERGESYTLYTISGVPREAFDKFPMPRNTDVFAPTFRGEGVVRSDDITADPRYGRNAPHHGMPAGHLPVRSYLAVPVMSRSGEVIGGMFFGHPSPGIFDDQAEKYAAGIAAQAAVALDNARLYSDLRRSEERFKLASRATNDAIWDWDLRSERVGWNQAIAEHFGHIEAVGGTTAAWWKEHIHPEDRDRVILGIHRVIDNPAAGVWEAEYRFERADGTWADVYDRGAVVRDDAGTPHRMVGAMQDVSERRRAERERQHLLESERSARAAAERAGRLKDEFLATLSHELRTPLNAILGWTHLLRKGLGEPEKAMRGVEVIERNARVQTQLISDLLDISRITTGKMRLDVQRVELPVVIDAALESVRPAADAKGVRIQTVIEPIADPVHGDPARLQQVVWNLLSNAVKFTPKNGRVQVVLSRVNSHIEIRVSDTGQGINAEFLPYVFERFRQADASSSREHAGLGLGLALVKQLVELHGGKVHAASAGEGRGATFMVELPLAILHPVEELPRVHPRTPLMPAPMEGPRLTGLRVLVIDDEADASDMVRRMLEDYGAHVVTAASADEGLEALSSTLFDAVLSDIGMPRKDGYEFIIEARRRGVRVPAAALTAFARSEDRTRALLAGYNSHVTKPVEPAELLATVVALTNGAERPSRP